MPVFALVDPDQHPVEFLTHVGEPLQVDHHRHLEVERRDLGDRLGNQIVMLHRRDGKLHPRHPPHLLGPQTAGVHNVLRHDGPQLGHHLPRPVTAWE